MSAASKTRSARFVRNTVRRKRKTGFGPPSFFCFCRPGFILNSHLQLCCLVDIILGTGMRSPYTLRHPEGQSPEASCHNLLRFIADEAYVVAKIFVDSREFQPRVLFGFGLEHFALFRPDFEENCGSRLEAAFGLL